MVVNYPELLKFSIRNTGKTGFYYSWDYNNEIIERKLEIIMPSREGYVKSDSETMADLTVTPLKNLMLKNFKMELKVKYGPCYKILMNVTISNINFKFSFLEFDFGPHFIQENDICHYSKILEVVNNDTNALLLENEYVNTNFLKVDFTSKTILPKTKENIAIQFYPRSFMKYDADIPFVCGNLKFIVKILGEGIPIDIVLEYPKDKCVSLGSPPAGTLVTKTISVINKSPVFADVLFDLFYRLPLPPITVHYIELSDKKPPVLEKKSVKGKKGKSKKSASDKSSKKKKGSQKFSDKSSKTKSEKSKKSSKKSSAKSSKSSKKSGKSEKKNKKAVEEPPTVERDIQKELIQSSISIIPNYAIRIFPNKKAEFTIRFMPTERMLPFTEKIYFQIYEKNTPLCVIQGKCIGPEFSLSSTTISFGNTFLHSEKEKTILLYNTGEVGASFKWTYEETEQFSIVPNEGFSLVDIPTNFSLKFCPTTLNKYYSFSMTCIIDGYQKELKINLFGTCIDLPEPIGKLTFTCLVRSEDKKTFTITNNSTESWKIYPTIAGEQFYTDDIIMIPSKSNKPVTVFYRPLVMTAVKTNHIGYISCMLPNGEAMVYSLSGTADPPAPIRKISFDIPSKQTYIQLLNVKNWLRTPQTYKIITEEVTSYVGAMYLIKGLEVIDIIGNGEKEYQWHFYSYKEGNYEFKVMFVNEQNEYLFYLISIHVTKCKPLDTFVLSTCVRTPITHNLTLINPLAEEIVYSLKCIPPELNFKTSVTVPLHSELLEQLEYNPIFPGEVTAILDATCAQLGTYQYEFQLTAHPSVPEPPLIFNVTLGDTKTLNASVKNIAKSKTDFTSEISDSDAFFIGKTVSCNPNQTLHVPIDYCPYQIENTKLVLKFSSPHSGDYLYPIEASCIHPKPKGPINFKPNASMTINFFNPFLNYTTFVLKTEPSIFTVKLSEEEFKPRSFNKIIVQFEADRRHYVSPINNVGISGKLMITTKNAPDVIKWTYYLNGDFTIN